MKQSNDGMPRRTGNRPSRNFYSKSRNRRQFFAQIGAPLMIGGLADCLGGSGTSEANVYQATGKEPNSGVQGEGCNDEQNGEPFNTDSIESYERYEIGDPTDPDRSEGSSPHAFYVWNDANKERKISIHIARDAESVFERIEVIPAGTYLEVLLVESGTYELVVELDGMKSKITIDRSWSDCTHSQTLLVVRTDGIKTQTRSVQSSCESATHE